MLVVVGFFFKNIFVVAFVCRHRLCAPIASLDCMEEFSGNTGHDMSMLIE